MILDGANVEIRDEVGADNIFIFGMTTDEVAQTYAGGYNPWVYYDTNTELRQTLDMLRDGYFSPGDSERFKPVFEALTYHGDHYRLLADYASYIACQDQVIHGPELIILLDGAGATVLAIGSGDWRWADLLKPAHERTTYSVSSAIGRGPPSRPAIRRP